MHPVKTILDTIVSASAEKGSKSRLGDKCRAKLNDDSDDML